MEQPLPNTLTGDYTGKPPLYSTGSIVTKYDYKGAGLGITYANIQSEADANCKQIDELVRVGNALAEIKQQLQLAKSGEPLTTAGARAINAAVEKMLASVGIASSCQISLENYYSTSSRRDALETALEGFSEGIVAIAAAIGRLLKRIFDYIYDDIEESARGAAAVARRSVRIQDAANKLRISARTLPKNKVTKGNVCSAFSINGSAMSFTTILNEYKQVMDDFNRRYSQHLLTTSVKSLASTIDSVINADKISIFTLDEAHQASDAALKYLLRNGFTDFKTDGEEHSGMEKFERPLPFGNAIFTASFRKEEGYYTGFSAKIETSGKNSATELPALTLEEIIELAKEVERQMSNGIYRDYLKVKKEVGSLGRTVEKQCNAIVKYKRSADEGLVPSLNFLKKVSEGVKDLVFAIYGYGGYSNRAILVYCENSIKQWK